MVSLISGGQCSFPFFTPHKARSQEIHNHLETPLSLSLYNSVVHHLASIVSFQLLEVGVKSRGREFRSPENTSRVRISICANYFFYLAILILWDPTFIPGCSQNNGTEPRICTKLEQEASSDTYIRISCAECTWDYLVLPIAQSPRNWQHGHHHLRHVLQTWQTSIISEGDYHSWQFVMKHALPCACSFTAQPGYYCCFGLKQGYVIQLEFLKGTWSHEMTNVFWFLQKDNLPVLHQHILFESPRSQTSPGKNDWLVWRWWWESYVLKSYLYQPVRSTDSCPHIGKVQHTVPEEPIVRLLRKPKSANSQQYAPCPPFFTCESSGQPWSGQWCDSVPDVTTRRTLHHWWATWWSPQLSPHPVGNLSGCTFWHPWSCKPEERGLRSVLWSW